MKVLLITYKIPFSSTDGGEYAQRNLVYGLNNEKDCIIDLLSMNTNFPAGTSIYLPVELDRINGFYQTDVNTKVSYVGAIRHIFSKHSYFVSRFFSPKFNSLLISVLKENEYDIVHLEHVYLCQYVKTIKQYSDAKIILRAQNVEHKLWETIIDNTRDPFKKAFLKLQNKRLEKFEKKSLNEVDGIISFTPKDQFLIAEITKNKIPVVRIPPGFIFTDEQQNHRIEVRSEKIKFYFIGSFDWQPNYQSIKWFLHHIYPDFKNNSSIEFHFGGKKAPLEFLKLKLKYSNLFFYDHIPDATEFLRDKHFLLAPIISGGGMKIKIIEALSNGKPVITTVAGAIGFEEVGKAVKICVSDREMIIEINSRIEELNTDSEIDSNKIKKQVVEYFDNQLLTSKISNFYGNILNYNHNSMKINKIKDIE